MNTFKPAGHAAYKTETFTFYDHDDNEQHFVGCGELRAAIKITSKQYFQLVARGKLVVESGTIVLD